MHNPKGCWRQCIAGTLVLFCTVGVNSNVFSVYIPYLTKLLELTPNQTSSFLMVRSIFSMSAVYLARYYYDKLDVRLGNSLAILLCSVAVFFYSRVSSFESLCVAGAISGIGTGLGGLYPVAILIHRWFPRHEGLAMGICSASTGLAITVCAPIITNMIERRSLAAAFYLEFGFLALCAVAAFLMIRNTPDTPLHFTHRPKATRHPLRIDPMFFAILAIGIMGNAFSYITTHYTTEGFDPYQVSTIVSVVGIFLVGAKFLLGELVDLWGSYRTNWLFFSVAAASCILFSFGSAAGYTVALMAGALYGIGDTIATLGVTIYARDLSSPEEYAATQQRFQFANTLGNLLCTLVPGPIATATGNYRGFFLFVTVAIVFATVMIQRAYIKKRRQ